MKARPSPDKKKTAGVTAITLAAGVVSSSKKTLHKIARFAPIVIPLSRECPSLPRRVWTAAPCGTPKAIGGELPWASL